MATSSFHKNFKLNDNNIDDIDKFIKDMAFETEEEKVYWQDIQERYKKAQQEVTYQDMERIKGDWNVAMNDLSQVMKQLSQSANSALNQFKGQNNHE